LFKPEEAMAFFEANEQKRPVTIRCNTLKSARSDLAKLLSERGCNVDKIGDWSKEGLKVFDTQVSLGATPEYLSGKYMVQSASSLVPVLALGAQRNESILDMAAAPGGKTTHIGQRMQNTGTLFANDLRADRCKSLIANVHRQGLQNVVIINYDGLKVRKHMPKLDRVLLDAPCTGSGIISRDPSIKMKRTVADFVEHSQLQKKLLLEAIDMVDAESKTGGIIVYSTCSVAFEEDECVVDWVLRTRKGQVKLVDFAEGKDAVVPFGVPGMKKYRGQTFDPSLSKTRRYYPHVHNMDGFYVAKFQKLTNTAPHVTKRDNRRVNPHIVWDDAKIQSSDVGVKPLEFENDKEEEGKKSAKPVVTNKQKKEQRKEKREQALKEKENRKKERAEKAKANKAVKKADRKKKAKAKKTASKAEAGEADKEETKEATEKKEEKKPAAKEEVVEKKVAEKKKKVVASTKTEAKAEEKKAEEKAVVPEKKPEAAAKPTKKIIKKKKVLKKD